MVDSAVNAVSLSALRRLMHARRFDSNELARRVDIPAGELENRLGDEKKITLGLVDAIARELAVPAFALFSEAASSPPEPIADFREERPSARAYERQTIQAIDLAQDIQQRALSLGHRWQSFRPYNLNSNTVPDVAGRIRAELGVSTDEQIACKDDREFFSIVRFAIEKRGLFVVQSSFPRSDGVGVCIYEERAPVIIVNTESQTHGRRLFTLAHELAHVVLRQTGISDPFVLKNKVEILCNRFAAAFLAPQSLVSYLARLHSLPRRPTLSDIANFARSLSISQQATVVRLEELGLVDAGSASRWLKDVRLAGNPDFQPRRGGGGETPQHKVKLARYGYTFGRVFGSALEQGAMAPIDIFRLSGLKPRYQGEFFRFTAHAGASDAEE